MSEIRSGNLTELDVNYFCNITFFYNIKYLTLQKEWYLKNKKNEYIPAVTSFKSKKKKNNNKK